LIRTSHERSVGAKRAACSEQRAASSKNAARSTYQAGCLNSPAVSSTLGAVGSIFAWLLYGFLPDEPWLRVTLQRFRVVAAHLHCRRPHVPTYVGGSPRKRITLLAATAT